MAKYKKNQLASHIDGLLKFLSQPTEKANEDLALAYFRKTFGEEFTRQQEAKQADGYSPGSFVLELKGSKNSWLSGLFQGLAYQNRGLDFSQIVVAAKEFLAIWRVEDIPEKIREEIASEDGAPSRIGTKYAKRYAKKRSALLKCAIWNGSELLTPLLATQPDIISSRIKSFEKTLREGRKVRQKITIGNFSTHLTQMKEFFDPKNPIKAVRAFYSMIYAWSEHSTVSISKKNMDQATIGGELIHALAPGSRARFKEFTESRYVVPSDDGSYDEYFARFDEALDAVDKNFRIKHGIFFTDLNLSRFVMWFVRQHIPELGKNYLVVDPAWPVPGFVDGRLS